MKFPFFKSAAKKFRRRRPVSASRDIPAMPGMFTADENAFFEDSAAASIGKAGSIVDLGCWLGGTSVALARGLGKGERVLAFDLFRWEGWMPAGVAYCLYQPGDSFLPEARRLTRDHAAGKIELIQADLTTYDWTGGPIKILLVDAMKSEALARQIARSFYPSLNVGGLLIHQDFKHFHTTWIHLLQYELRDHFRICRVVPHSSTVAFEVVKTIPSEVVARASNFRSLSNQVIDTCFRHSIELVGKDANVAAAHVMHYIHLGQKERAQSTLDNYRRLGLTEEGEIMVVARRLKSFAPVKASPRS